MTEPVLLRLVGQCLAPAGTLQAVPTNKNITFYKGNLRVCVFKIIWHIWLIIYSENIKNAIQILAST